MHLCGVKHWLGDWGQRVLGSGATSILQSPVGLLRALSGPVLFNIFMDDLDEGIEAKANNVGFNKAMGPAVGSPQPHTALQALGRVAGKPLNGKVPAGAARHLDPMAPCPGSRAARPAGAG